MKNLNFNKYIYTRLKRKITDAIERGEELTYVFGLSESLADYAWKNYPGRLGDEKLEEWLVDISRKDQQIPKSNLLKKQLNKNRVLHYATGVYDIGGHTRVIENWVSNDERNSYLYVKEGDIDIPRKLEQLNLQITKDQTKEFYDKARSFITLVEEVKPYYIILHNHPNDAFPIFLKTKLTEIPFVFFNHADFVFSICSFSSDFGISFFETSKKINDRYRFKKPSFVLPLYVENRLDDPRARKRDNKELKLVIMSSYYKAIPKDEWNIFTTIQEIQKLDQVSQINVIGIDETQAKLHVNKNFNRKVKFHGTIVNPTSILRDSDIFLEPYPIGTGLGTLEAILTGNLPIFSVCPSIIYPFGAVMNLFPKALRLEYEQIVSYKDYITFLKSEIINYKPEKYVRYKEYLVQTHYSDWVSKLNNIYDSILENKSGLNIKTIELSNEESFAEIKADISGTSNRNFDFFFKSFHFLEVLYIMLAVCFLLDSRQRSFSKNVKFFALTLKRYSVFKFKQQSSKQIT